MLGKFMPLWETGTYDRLGDVKSYELCAEWLKGLDVEDWGCGPGFFKQYVTGKYRGLDGTNYGPVDEVVDLVTYRSQTAGLILRHVLEHNHDWGVVLDNAVASFTKRMVVVLYTPSVLDTQFVPDSIVTPLGIPAIAFKLSDLTERLIGCKSETVRPSWGETILLVEKESA
jgi:hypothetical protein